jgi:hypothetical protein
VIIVLVAVGIIIEMLEIRKQNQELRKRRRQARRRKLK